MTAIHFTSKPQLYVLPPDATPYAAEFDGVQIAEIIEVPSDDEQPARSPRPLIHRYHLRICVDVHTCQEAHQAQHDSMHLIEQLELVWQYVVGVPMRPLRIYLEDWSGPEGWTTNFKDVHAELQARGQQFRAEVKLVSRHWMHLPFLPLERALTAVRAYRSSSEITRTLINIHHDAMNSMRREGRLFLLAKGLELVRALLPGKSLNAQASHLNADVRQNMAQSLSWLYDMSNNRLDIRHVVRDPDGPQLHPPMTRKESKDFEHDADLVIRGVVSDLLSVDVAVVQELRPTTA